MEAKTIDYVATSVDEVSSSELKKTITDDGQVDVSRLPAIEENKYREIARSLNENDMTSVSSFGSDLQRAMDSYSSGFLKHQMGSDNTVEATKLITNLLAELNYVDVDDLEAPSKLKRMLRKIPLLNKLVLSVEQIKSKYNTIEKNIDTIVKKLEATRQIALRDNTLLQHQFENNCNYVDQLGDLVIAGRIKCKEIDAKLEEMSANPTMYHDYEVSDLREYRALLDKRITDLALLRYAFKQSLTQIRIIQRTNLLDANNTESHISMTIPLWKNQLSLAVALYNQRQSIEVKDKCTEATNQILMKNSEMMKTQAIEVARQNQRSVIDIETLKKTTSDLLSTIEGVRKAQEEGAAKRAAAELEICKLERQVSIAAIGMADATQKITAKELQHAKVQV